MRNFLDRTALFCVCLMFSALQVNIAFSAPIYFEESKLTRLEESWSGGFGNSISSDGDTLAIGAVDWMKTENCCSCGSVFVYYREPAGSGDWKEIKKVVASDCSSSLSNTVSNFGQDVVISGDTLVVGSYDPNWSGDVHALYIFERNQSGADNWGQTKKITVPINSSLAFDGDTIIAGGTSTAYIFERDYGGVGNWGKVKEITIAGGTQVAYKVALDGDTAVIGRSYYNDAHIFERNQGGSNNWGEVVQITPSDGESSDGFGYAVAISGDLISVSAPSSDAYGTDSGSVYVFERNFGGGDNWGQVKKVNRIGAASEDRFGSQISIAGSILMSTTTTTGKAYVFYQDEGGTNQWGQVHEIVTPLLSVPGVYSPAPPPIHVSDNNSFIGIPMESVKGFKMGAVFVFQRNKGGDDQWGESQLLFPQDTRYVAGDRFGVSVACSEETIAVGAHLDDESGGSSGAVYIFEKNLFNDNEWGQYRKITSVYDITAGGDYFGWAIGLDSGLLVVGAYNDDDLGSNAGAAYILDRNEDYSNDGWGYDKVAKILPDDGVASDFFGYSVAISNDTVVVGAYQDDDLGTSSGAAYVFQQDQGGEDKWGQIQKLLPNDGAASDFFGYKVEISGDTIAVGAYQDDDLGSSSGSVYLFERNNGGLNNWGQIRKVLAPDGAASDYFGRSLSINSDTLIVAAPGDDERGSASGSAYIFYRNQGGENNWGFVKKITASDGAASDNFGTSVEIKDGLAAVGAHLDDDMGPSSGSVYIFQVNEGGLNNWGEIQKITASDGFDSDNFGESVCFSGNFIAIGASLDDDNGSSSGSVYVLSYGTDADGDGLSDSTESSSCTLSNDADTDDDGLSDGAEDVNHNGIVDMHETNPCNVDTDGDGLQDGTELSLIATNVSSDTDLSYFIADADPVTSTDPLEQDSDGDGLLDGREDINFNGRWDSGETAADVVSGDYNLNGTADLTDLILSLQALTSPSISGTFDVSADTDGDHKVDLPDSIYILRLLEAGK